MITDAYAVLPAALALVRLEAMHPRFDLRKCCVGVEVYAARRLRILSKPQTVGPDIGNSPRPACDRRGRAEGALH